MALSKKTGVVGLLIALAVVAAGLVLYRAERKPETSPVFLGEKLAIQSGCFACHGRDEAENRINYRPDRSGGWRPASIPTLWEDGITETDELVEWIRDGCPEEKAERHKQLFIQMPAYGGEFLKPDEIDAIAAWILAEGLKLTEGMGNGTLPMVEMTAEEVSGLDQDRLFVLGDRISRQQGCYQCHGELGQGGVQNPASFKGTIPGFFGSEFLELTDGGDRAEILHWIDHGRGHAIESGLMGTFAKRFFDSQAIPMPGYEDVLNDGEKALLVEFLLLLNEKGPLGARDVENLSKLLTGDGSHTETTTSNP